MPRKPPRRTRERIVATALALFNAAGEPHVTTADIADEMNISPGNLYYHFRNKDDIIGELYGAFAESVAPLLAGPSARAADVEDLWLFMPGEVEVRIVAPPSTRGSPHRALAKAPEHEESLVHDVAQPRERKRPVEHQHAADHHQVGRPIHPQPRGVDRRDLFALAHQTIFLRR